MSVDIELKTLTALIMKSDKQAYNELFMRYCRSLVFYVNDLLRQPEAAEDIVQDVFIKIWEKRSELDPDRSLQALLYTMAYRLALNHIRDSKKNILINKHHEMIMADNPPDILFEKMNEIKKYFLSSINYLPKPESFSK